MDKSGNVSPTTPGGILTRILPTSVFTRITKPRHAFPLGLLFGLSFDTAASVSLLCLGATSNGLTLSTLILPVLFTAAMTIVDGADSILMCYAYAWSAADPTRRLFFNIYLTVLSAAIAGGVAVVELAGLGVDAFGFTGRFWVEAKALNDHFEYVGYGIVGIFIASFAVAGVVYRREKAAEEGEVVDLVKEGKVVDDYVRQRMLEMAQGKVEVRGIDI